MPNCLLMATNVYGLLPFHLVVCCDFVCKLGNSGLCSRTTDCTHACKDPRSIYTLDSLKLPTLKLHRMQTFYLLTISRSLKQRLRSTASSTLQKKVEWIYQSSHLWAIASKKLECKVEWRIFLSQDKVGSCRLTWVLTTLNVCCWCGEMDYSIKSHS